MKPPPKLFFVFRPFCFLNKKGSVWSISAFQLQKYFYSPACSFLVFFFGESQNFFGISYKKAVWTLSFPIQSSILKIYQTKEAGREGLVLKQSMPLQFMTLFSEKEQAAVIHSTHMPFTQESNSQVVKPLSSHMLLLLGNVCKHVI